MCLLKCLGAGLWLLMGLLVYTPGVKKEAQIDMFVGIELLPSHQLILNCIAWRLSMCVRTACTDKYSPCFMCVPHLTDCKRIPINRHIRFNFVTLCTFISFLNFIVFGLV